MESKHRSAQHQLGRSWIPGPKTLHRRILQLILTFRPFLRIIHWENTKRKRKERWNGSSEIIKKFTNDRGIYVICLYNGRDCVSAQNPVIVSKFCRLFDFRPQKTYNPPRKFNLKGNRFLAFLIGFIDGDGCISYQTGREDCLLSIKCHKSWLPLLQTFSDLLYELAQAKSSMPKINNQGYAHWYISNNAILKFLKFKAIQMGIPVLTRKWDKIDLDRVSRTERSYRDKQEVLRLHAAGYRQKDICEQVGLKKSTVCMILKRSQSWARRLVRQEPFGSWRTLNSF